MGKEMMTNIWYKNITMIKGTYIKVVQSNTLEILLSLLRADNDGWVFSGARSQSLPGDAEGSPQPTTCHDMCRHVSRKLRGDEDSFGL